MASIVKGYDRVANNFFFFKYITTEQFTTVVSLYRNCFEDGVNFMSNGKEFSILVKVVLWPRANSVHPGKRMIMLQENEGRQ